MNMKLSTMNTSLVQNLVYIFTNFTLSFFELYILSRRKYDVFVNAASFNVMYKLLTVNGMV